MWSQVTFINFNVVCFRYGAQSLSVSQLIPSIVKLLVDPTPVVRAVAFNTLVEVYRYIGDRLHIDLLNVPAYM
jgi:hypothetical protein